MFPCLYLISLLYGALHTIQGFVRCGGTVCGIVYGTEYVLSTVVARTAVPWHFGIGADRL